MGFGDGNWWWCGVFCCLVCGGGGCGSLGDVECVGEDYVGGCVGCEGRI